MVVDQHDAAIHNRAYLRPAGREGAGPGSRRLIQDVVRILFICSENRLRSPTAAAVFSEFEGVDAISAGTNKDCECPVSGDLIEWADAILVMEATHRSKISRRFGDLLRDRKLAVLEIPDIFEFMDPMLVALLKARVPRYVHIP